MVLLTDDNAVLAQTTKLFLNFQTPSNVSIHLELKPAGYMLHTSVRNLLYLVNTHDAIPETTQAAWTPCYESAFYFHKNCL